MNWWDLVRQAGDTLLVHHAVPAAFAFLLVEESGVPIPVPGDFLMLTLGIRARDGAVSLWQVVAAMEAGTVLGASLLYLVARRGGREIVNRFGRLVGLDAARLARVEVDLHRRGGFAVALGRLLPGLRVLTAIACGTLRVPFRVFLPAMSLASLVYIIAYTMLGYWAGPTVLGLVERLHLPVGLVGSGLPLVLLVMGLVLIRRRAPHPLPRPRLRSWHRAQVGMLAGAVASASALLTLNVVVVVAGDLVWRLPNSALAEAAGRLSIALAGDTAGGLLWLVVPIITGFAWGACYGTWAEPRLRGPDAVRGLLALLPFAVGAGLLAPLLAQVQDLTRLAPVALLTEAARQACFGLTLGLAYPVLRARQRPAC